ncbi:MAG: hypothetical protein OEV79_05575 [candidate division WOR-3 bacterium]|nr:hypothetical protein [candidate division WOR-3 bacterium]
MKNNKAPQLILKIISVLIMFGGGVRLFAERKIFESFLIDELWSSHPYFIYIYRVLGGFVVSAGVMLFTIARDPIRYEKSLQVSGFCFSFIACVMFLSGLLLKMSFLHYAFDFVFCLITAWVCFALYKQNAGMPADSK